MILLKDAKGIRTMNKKIQSTYDRFLKSLTSQERKDFKDEYQELAFAELLIALMQKDDVSVRRLAEEAGISPTIIQGIRSGTRSHVSMQSFFKILQGLGCKKLLVEHNGHLIPFDISLSIKKNNHP